MPLNRPGLSDYGDSFDTLAVIRFGIPSAASPQRLMPAWPRRSNPWRPNRAWQHPIAKGLLVTASLLLALAPARAIPEAEALKKLAVVPVFVLTDSKGVPLPIPKDKALVLPLYLERSRAEAELATLQKANPGLLARLVAVPLNTMTVKIKQLQLQLKDRSRTLVAPVIAKAADRQQAILLLKQQGLTDKQIQEGLTVPVFFTKPFLSLSAPQTTGKAEPKLLFFMSYASLQEAIASLPRDRRSSLKPQVADLSAVLRQIIQSPQDRYGIVPSADYDRLVQQQSANQHRPGTGAQAPIQLPGPASASAKTGDPAPSQPGTPSTGPVAPQATPQAPAQPSR